MKYGILGGTFDPPHLGHTKVARAAIDSLGLDEVIWVPASKNPLKQRKTTPVKHRLAMCRLATEAEDKMAVSDIDATRAGPSYLVDTLEEFSQVMFGQYWFIMGSDTLSTFQEWKKPERVLRMCRLAVVSRHGTDLSTILSRLDPVTKDAIDMVEAKHDSVSSSFVRDCIRKREAYNDLIVQTVYEYIQKNKLYED